MIIHAQCRPFIYTTKYIETFMPPPETLLGCMGRRVTQGVWILLVEK
jgi:hypothetical protein